MNESSDHADGTKVFYAVCFSAPHRCYYHPAVLSSRAYITCFHISHIRSLSYYLIIIVLLILFECNLIVSCELEDQATVALCEGLQTCPALEELFLGEWGEQEGAPSICLWALLALLSSLQLPAFFFILVSGWIMLHLHLCCCRVESWCRNKWVGGCGKGAIFKEEAQETWSRWVGWEWII